MRKKSFLSSLLLSLAMVIGFAPAVFATPSSNSIWCGLQSGANFDTSGTCPPKTPPVQGNQYAALGDSVAAGQGLAQDPNASAMDKQCGRSTQSYSALIAKNLKIPLVNAACSGATVGDLFTKQRVDGPNIAPQLNTAFAAGVPQFMTITAGANDVHWADFVNVCYAKRCDTHKYSIAASVYISAMKFKLNHALESVNTRSGGHPPKTIITGYYNPFSAACANDKLTASEIAWLTNENNALNTAIQQVSSKYPFAIYTSLNFEGHDICSSDPWVQGPNDPAPLHPTITGQQVIADRIFSILG